MDRFSILTTGAQSNDVLTHGALYTTFRRLRPDRLLAVQARSQGAQSDVPLVIQPLPGIGDLIWHLPHIHAIAAASPAGQVDVLAKRRSLADRLLAADPAVRDILWLERPNGIHAGAGGVLRLARDLRKRRYRRCWIMHTSPRYALTTWFAGIPERIGFGFGAQKLLLQRSAILPPSVRRNHQVYKANALLKRVDIAMTESEPVLVLDPARVGQVRATYADHPQPWIALGIGSSEHGKQWGAEKFAELAAQLIARGATCLLIGGQAEASMAQRMVTRIGAGAGANQLLPIIASPIDTVASILSLCKHCVSNDTGVLNMAAAVGVPCTGLFGGSMPLRHSKLIRCIEADPSVVMDRSGTSMYPDAARGMASISVERVLEVLESD